MQIDSFVLLTLLQALPGFCDGIIDSQMVSNVVVIPDVHGDRYAAVLSLWKAFTEIENTDIEFKDFDRILRIGDGSVLSRMPQSTIVVQLGDLLDRGPDTMETFLLFDRIPKVIGWQTIRLFGNHELASIVHKYEHFVHVDDYYAFGGVGPRQSSFAYGGSMFAWLASSTLALARLESPLPWTQASSASTLFVHGGIELSWFLENELGSDVFDVAAFNAKFNTMLREPDAQKRLENMRRFVDDVSPMWTRSFETMTDFALCGSYIDEILSRFNVARIIVGHNPQENFEPRVRCGGKILLIDTRMSRWMNSMTPELEDGHPTAVVIKIGPGGVLESLESQTTDLKYQMMDTVRPLVDGWAMRGKRFFVKQQKAINMNSPEPGVPRLFRKLHENIYFAEWDQTRGLVLFGEDPAVWESFRGVSPSFQSGLFPACKLRNNFVKDTSFDSVPFVFVETPTKMSLGQVPYLSANMVEQVRTIMNQLHSQNFLVGFKDGQDSLFQFGLDPDTQRVELIDFSHVRFSAHEADFFAEQMELRELVESRRQVLPSLDEYDEFDYDEEPEDYDDDFDREAMAEKISGLRKSSNGFHLPRGMIDDDDYQ